MSKKLSKPIVEVHKLIPKHSKLGDREKKALLSTYNITVKELPKILKGDPAIAHLVPDVGDVIKIERHSATAGKTVFYRGVING